MSTENPPIAIQEITPMIPRVRVRPLFSNVPGEDSPVERVFCHRLDLEAVEQVGEDFFAKRERQEAYLYRSGFRGDATLVSPSFGKSDKGSKGAYQLSTSWAVKHPGALLSFLPFHHGRWDVVTFSEATANPPERLALPRREKPRRSRPLLPPRG